MSDQRSLRREARRELGRLAERGERGAQVTLGNDYAREAERLGFSPAAANEALPDAVRGLSSAATRGFPGAPSLDRAGNEFQPIRVQRTRP